jgi:hypothetical protein
VSNIKLLAKKIAMDLYPPLLECHSTINYEVINSSCFAARRFSTRLATIIPTSYNTNSGTVDISVVKKSGEGDMTAPNISNIITEYRRVRRINVPDNMPMLASM